jgi:1,4-alpha-glucan branching enzyme
MAEGLNLLSDNDYYYFQEGTHTQLSSVLGAHPSQRGTHFGVWAPNAKRVSVVGDFNHWDSDANSLTSTGRGGIWQGFVDTARHGAKYQFCIQSARTKYNVLKADPLGVFHDTPPKTASILWNLDYTWGDRDWMRNRANTNALRSPISIYEVHLGSWRRVTEEKNRHLTYRELADQLIPYVKEIGFTHLEFLPIMEHPFYGSWGYQTTGYFAPTSRYGTPQDFMHLIDRCHQNGIGVILDWVPSHFPNDEYGLGFFDGVHEYEPTEPTRRVHPDWNSFIFDYARPEVRSFLLSSAFFWLQQYHADALRVDAVASMLYLDYSRKEGQWIPNQYGGHENLDAIAFLRVLNEDVYKYCPDTQTIAEESTAWPRVSKPTYSNGLGFGLKWDMGWMHDTLNYMSQDPVYRKYHHHELIFRSVYAFSENFVLPLSHDEVVYGKGSLLQKMPGETSLKFANLRTLYAYMYAQPGKKLLFMGNEFGQRVEWAHDGSLQWDLLELPEHTSLRLLVGTLNHLYRSEPALSETDFNPEAFEWIHADDSERNIIAFLRKRSDHEQIIAVCNFSPVPRSSYRLGAPVKGTWREILNTDATSFGGTGRGNRGSITTVPIGLHGRPYSLTLELPALSVLYLKWEPAL